MSKQIIKSTRSKLKREKLPLIKLAKRQRGFTLLEYCAGAAVIVATLYVSLRAFGGTLDTLLDTLGTWAGKRAQEIEDVERGSGT